jgi:hypothetical protein
VLSRAKINRPLNKKSQLEERVTACVIGDALLVVARSMKIKIKIKKL